MSVRADIFGSKKTILRTRLFQFFCVAAALGMTGCSGAFDTEPLVEYSTEVRVEGTRPQTVTRELRAGVYLLEVRERDIDLRVSVDAGSLHTALGDAYIRHGLHRLVVSLEQATTLRIGLSSLDQRSWRGGAALRILRWPKSAANSPPDERLLGFMALGKGNELVARADTASWRASIRPYREAAAHFQAANDWQTLAEAEYQRGFVEFNLLFDFDTGRKTAAAAMAHFDAAGDQIGAMRASTLLALNEFNFAAGMKLDVPRSQQVAMLDRAFARTKKAQAFFEAHDLPTDAMLALMRSGIRQTVLGLSNQNEPMQLELLRRARQRGDRYFEATALNSMAYSATRRGDMALSATLFEQARRLIDRERNADLFATLTSNLGHSLISLGDFDRALVLHTEALEMFSARGDDQQTARELLALCALQFRSGNLEQAMASINSALPLFERAHDLIGESSALRLAGNTASELGQHELALQYLRKAALQDRNGLAANTTRILMAGELRMLGDLRGAEQLLGEVVTGARNESTHADSLAERARLRQSQHRNREALADLREADAINARLGLDFNRIDTSSSLALALLESGDLQGASAAADAAVEVESRIRVKSANPETRARFLSASYAPYEARIEVDLAGAAPKDAAAIWKAFRTAEAVRGRSMVDRLVHTKSRTDIPRDDAADRLRAALTSLQIALERRIRRGDEDEDGLLETRRLIDETRARLDTRLLSDRAVQSSNGLTIAESRASVQAALPADTAVLAYFVGDRRSHGWLLTRTQLRHITLPGRSALQHLVDDFVARARTGVRSPADAWFAPLLGNLLNGVDSKRLLILPDGPLNGLPFAALPLPHGQPHELLIDRFVIAAAPSLALALRPVVHRGSETTRIAVISDPVYTPDDRRLSVAATNAATYRGAGGSATRLARLPYSAIEARAVVRAFEGSDVIELAGFNATARRVIELPSDELGVLHFATHAVTRKDAPEQSALFLSEYAADGTVLPSDRLTADDIARSGLRADVVVLSGCATGDGRELRGEGVLGLTYGFLANGSQTVIASLWPIEDAVTARFMEEFYVAYRASGRATDALRIAQLHIRRTTTSPVWSSFVVRANGLP